ncbi:MAG TPA: S41 family peptidase [Vicinamibacterales bacterium]
MASKSRLTVFLVSTPLVVVAVAGGLLGTSALARQQGVPQLRMLDDCVQLIRGAYVQPVDIDKVFDGAMRGLADGLDSSSAYLTPAEVKDIQSNVPLGAGETGLVVTKQFYLRVVGVRDGSPAARAGLRTGDNIRGIDGQPTREMSAIAGTRLLRGTPGSKVVLSVFRNNVVDIREFPLERAALTTPLVSSKPLAGGAVDVRIASFAIGASAALASTVDSATRAGASRFLIDIRGTSDGPVDEGIAAARLFIKSGVIAILAGREATDQVKTNANPGDGSVTAPVVLLISNGTAGAAEVFAAALSGHDRAELVGEPTAGVAAVEHLVPLPEGAGLWLTYRRYLTIDGQPIHERGLRPTIGVEEPFIGFDDTPPTTDPVLDRGLDALKKAKNG